MESIIKLFDKKLAALFDKLRIASPTAYVILLIIVFGVPSFLENFTSVDIDIPWLFNGIVDEIAQALIAIILSSRTKRYLDEADDSPEGAKVLSIDHND